MVVAADWDRERFKPGEDLVVLETVEPPSTDGQLLLSLDRLLPAIQGPATPSRPQTYTIQLEPTFFADNFNCQRECDADRYNPAHLRSSTELNGLRGAVTVRDVTEAGREIAVGRPAAPPPQTRTFFDDVRWFTLEDLGFERQPPSRT
jgi:hypothetical protein